MIYIYMYIYISLIPNLNCNLISFSISKLTESKGVANQINPNIILFLFYLFRLFMPSIKGTKKENFQFFVPV